MTSVSITPMNMSQSTGQTPKPLGLNLKWTTDEAKKTKNIIAKYPKGQQQSAVIPLLRMAQSKCGGWLPVDAMQLVAETLEMPYVRVYEVATFYTMFNLKPVGQFHVQVCTNCSCLIRGSDAVVKAVKDIAGVQRSGATSQDGMFTFTEVECLGACVAAPMMQIGTHYFTKLDEEKTKQILKHLQQGGDLATHADTPPADPDPVHFSDYEERI